MSRIPKFSGLAWRNLGAVAAVVVAIGLIAAKNLHAQRTFFQRFSLPGDGLLHHELQKRGNSLAMVEVGTAEQPIQLFANRGRVVLRVLRVIAFCSVHWYHAFARSIIITVTIPRPQASPHRLATVSRPPYLARAPC